MGETNDAFQSFRKKVEPELVFVEKLLRQPLSEEPQGLVADLRRAEAWYSRMQTLAAFAEGHLDVAEDAKMPDKKNLTELERVKRLGRLVAAERLLRDRTGGLVEALRNRVSLGQTLLNYYRDVFFSEKGGRDPKKHRG